MKKREVNVSQAIRDAVNANGEMKSKEIAALVSKQVGKTIAPSYVSNIKGLMRSKNGTKGKKKKALISASQASSEISRLDIELARQEGLTEGLRIARKILG